MTEDNLENGKYCRDVLKRSKGWYRNNKPYRFEASYKLVEIDNSDWCKLIHYTEDTANLILKKDLVYYHKTWSCYLWERIKDKLCCIRWKFKEASIVSIEKEISFIKKESEEK